MIVSAEQYQSFGPVPTHCSRQAVLVMGGEYGMFRWRCECCKQSWVVVGSPMDVANELIWANRREEEWA